MTAAVVENMEHKKARAEEANLLLEGLDEVTQKALYIATKMVLAKRDTEEGTKKARNCLKCNSRLLNLKDNVVNTCEVCGQQHLVDFYTNNTIVLTAAERPELRKRPGTPKPEQPKREQNQEAFNKRLAKFREKWKEY